MSDNINNQNNTESPTPSPPLSHNVELNSLSSNAYFLYEALATGVTLEQLKLYVKYPMKYNRQIRQLTREMYSAQGIFGNVVDYSVSAPTLDFITICSENTKKNQKKRKLFNQVIDKLNHKLTSRDILLHLFLDGMYVGILRDTQKKKVDATYVDLTIIDKLEGLVLDDNLMIQPLNLDYVKFVGFQNNDYVVAFDMQYFDSFSGNGLQREIRNYPIDFAKAYLAYKKDALANRWYKLDQKTTVALKFKANINEPFGRTLAIAALSDMFFEEMYTESQRANVSELSGNIYHMTLPEAEKKGQCSLNQDQQKNQVAAFEGAVKVNTSDGRIGKVTTLTLAPGTEIGKLSRSNDLLKDTLTDENIKKISTSLGFASGALNGEGNSTYSSLQVNIDLILTQIYQITEQIQWQYTKVFNNLLNAKGKDLIKFIYFKTSNLNKEKEFEIAKDLYTNAGGSRLWMYAVGTGMVDDYMALMEYEKEENFDEKYPPHLSSFTANNDSIGGRPTENTKNSQTEKSKTLGTNKTPKPSTK